MSENNMSIDDVISSEAIVSEALILKLKVLTVENMQLKSRIESLDDEIVRLRGELNKYEEAGKAKKKSTKK